ncbi:hypothetical protein D3C79_726070 [compost metagenome]
MPVEVPPGTGLAHLLRRYGQERQALRTAAAQAAAQPKQGEDQRQPGVMRGYPGQGQPQECGALDQYAGAQQPLGPGQVETPAHKSNGAQGAQRPGQHQRSGGRGAKPKALLQVQGCDQVGADEHARHAQVDQHRRTQQRLAEQVQVKDWLRGR